MPGEHHTHAAATGRQQGAGDGGERLGGRAFPLEDGLEAALQGSVDDALQDQRAPGHAQGGAEGGRGRSVAGDVADEERGAAVGQGEGVEEVPAQEHAMLAEAIALTTGPGANSTRAEIRLQLGMKPRRLGLDGAHPGLLQARSAWSANRRARARVSGLAGGA